MIGGEAEKKVFDAVSREDLARFEQMLAEDPFLVNGASFTCSRNLLHIATLSGHAGIVEEMLKISPRLARSLDSQKWSPLHIAAAEGNVEIVKKLLTVAPEMCWSGDWQGMNPIHIAAMNGHVAVVQEMVELDLLPAMERVHRGQTVLHLCVKHRQLRALHFLVGELPGEFVCAKDDDGDTVLHWAVRSNQVEMVRCLVNSNKLIELTKNCMGKTALSILTKIPRDTSNNYSEIKRLFMMVPTAPKLESLPDMSGIIMVVAALITTMAFQVAVSPPDGVLQADISAYDAGQAVIASTCPILYETYFISNIAAFEFSLLTLFLLSIGLFFENPRFQVAALSTMWLSIVFIVLSYEFSLTVITPRTMNVPLVMIVIGALASLAAILMLVLNGSIFKSTLHSLLRRILRQQDDVRADPQLALSPRLNPPLRDHV